MGRRKNRSASKKKCGWVALVGAGPGDPGLLTLRGRVLLEHCDLVVYDALVDPAILSFAVHAQKRKIDKHGRYPGAAQEKINRLLIREARKGKRIVRLKGGDPFIFGRGGEEALAVRRSGIPFEVVPGVSAGHAVPAYAGIPLTHRDLASQVTFVTGHQAQEKAGAQIDWKLLAKLRGTIVAFMGLKQLPTIIKKLETGGLKSSTKISIIERGTTPRQSVVTGTFRNIMHRLKRRTLHTPALAVIGEVNRLRPFLNWFENQPLFGCRVVIARPREQAGEMMRQLRLLGAEAVECPTIEILPVPYSLEIKRALEKLPGYDYLIFTSTNGVSCFWRHFRQSGYDIRQLAGLKVVAIGPATAERLNELGIKADLVPKQFTTDALVNLLRKTNTIQGKKVFMARADIANRELAENLLAAGASEVKDLIVYRTRPRRLSSKEMTALMPNGKPTYLVFTSSSTVLNFVRSLGSRKARAIARKSHVISIGPVTSGTARQAGFKVSKEAYESTSNGVLSVILECQSGKSSRNGDLVYSVY